MLALDVLALVLLVVRAVLVVGGVVVGRRERVPDAELARLVADEHERLCRVGVDGHREDAVRRHFGVPRDVHVLERLAELGHIL